MSTTIAFITSTPGFVPTLFGWLAGALLIVGVFLFNRSLIKAREQQ